MSVQLLRAHAPTDTDLNFQIALFVSLLGLTISLALLPLLGGELGMVLALAS
jgi:hypothetical protein